VLCQAAGATALPYPLVEEILAIDGARLALVNPEAPRIDHGDLPVTGRRGPGWHPVPTEPTSRRNAKLGPFLVPATLSAPDGTVSATTLTFISCSDRGGFWERCSSTAHRHEHVRARIQFGKPLADFQAVRFTVADASVAVRGLHELAKYTISRPEGTPAQIRSADALVLRFKAADTARQVLRASHNCSAPWVFVTSPMSACSTDTPTADRLPLGARHSRSG